MSPKQSDHIRLFIPGPVEVRAEILAAQAEWMIGHRSAAFAELYARMQPKLQQTFFTANPVYVYTSSGTGIWESASRCAVRDDRKILHLTCGAFSERWAEVSAMNGKQVDVLAVDWGQANKPEQLAEALRQNEYDAVAAVMNETSTGVRNPIEAYAEILADYPETLFLVDVVSAYVGDKVPVDEWGIDVCLTSTQKAFALPPGMAFGAVSPDAGGGRKAPIPSPFTYTCPVAGTSPPKFRLRPGAWRNPGWRVSNSQASIRGCNAACLGSHAMTQTSVSQSCSCVFTT